MIKGTPTLGNFFKYPFHDVKVTFGYNTILTFCYSVPRNTSERSIMTDNEYIDQGLVFRGQRNS